MYPEAPIGVTAIVFKVHSSLFSRRRKVAIADRQKAPNTKMIMSSSSVVSCSATPFPGPKDFNIIGNTNADRMSMTIGKIHIRCS